MSFADTDISGLTAALAAAFDRIYKRAEPIPMQLSELPAIPQDGRGLDALPELWSMLIDGSARLASPLMMGHMDTGPHPAAALSEAVVSALNNNLLFRELSPIASNIEEAVLDDLQTRLGLSEDWAGTFASGGSVANLTALFAACGGFGDVADRQRCRLYVSESVHVSVKKSAAVLGLPPEQVLVVPGDDIGRIDPAALDELLAANAGNRNIVVGVLGSTIHGAVDPVNDIGRVARDHGAWYHVDAIHGGALAFSVENRRFLAGLDAADSIVLGPQKWMYVPRLSATIHLRDKSQLDGRLGVDLPYSATGAEHRGKWGLQGSRRADAVTLWLTLQVLGAKSLGVMVDGAIDKTQIFHEILHDRTDFSPTHRPDLNLQCFVPGGEADDEALSRAHRALTEGGGPWVSLSRWRGRLLFRSVLLSPDIDRPLLEDLLDRIAI